ncbi:MAG: guanylate kinase [Clostridia bacterium]|nr:guanylate kinase [Clostridia bacterium]
MAIEVPRGFLIVLSGPSGCGKGTVLAKLLAEREDTVLSVSVTTRSPRPGDQDGVQYYFRTHEQFEQMIADDALLEYACYNGNYYGTPKAAVEEHLAAGRNVILEIEVQGAEKVMAKWQEPYVSLFLAAPSLLELESRLRGRDTEKEEDIRNRLAAAREELQHVSSYQYLVVNDEIDLAAARIHTIIEAEKLRITRNKNTLEALEVC